VKRRFLVKETALAFVAMLALSVLLSAVFSSPDEPPVTIAQWASAAPSDFLTTATAELAGTSETSVSGPPYTQAPGAGEDVVGGISLQRLAGVRIPVDPARDFVLAPLVLPAATNPQLASALRRYERASRITRQAWLHHYAGALADARGEALGPLKLAPGDYGPVRTLMTGLLAMARSGGLDGALSSGDRFYGTDHTRPLLFLDDGEYLETLAGQAHLLGSQWGMMNETGNFPGQPWLWLYTYWYQVSPFDTSRNVDAQVWGIMAVLSLVLVLVPYIPGLRSIPRWTRVYRLIWRDWYREARQARSP
jgi:hypothetical protein